MRCSLSRSLCPGPENVGEQVLAWGLVVGCVLGGPLLAPWCRASGGTGAARTSGPCGCRRQPGACLAPVGAADGRVLYAALVMVAIVCRRCAESPLGTRFAAGDAHGCLCDSRTGQWPRRGRDRWPPGGAPLQLPDGNSEEPRDHHPGQQPVHGHGECGPRGEQCTPVHSTGSQVRPTRAARPLSLPPGRVGPGPARPLRAPCALSPPDVGSSWLFLPVPVWRFPVHL